MHIIHGTWIPENTNEFVQRGAFYLWVETDAITNKTRKNSDDIHPRHLTQTALAMFLMEKLGLGDMKYGELPGSFCTKYFLLPTAGGKPSPAFELLRYMEVEEPLEFDLEAWQVNCYRVTDIIATLNDIHFIALNAAEDFQLGADFLFWHQYSLAMKGIIAKDQYIPALKYEAITSLPAKGKKAEKIPSFEIHPSWELLSDIYEKNIQRYVAAMPGVCTAGLNSRDESCGLFDRESLLRHFSECLLHDIVVGTPFTAKFEQQIGDTLLYRCVFPYRPILLQASPEKKLEE